MIDNKKLGEILVKEKYLDESVIAKILPEAEGRNIFLGTLLIEGGYLTKDLLGQAIAESYGLDYADINSRPPGPELVELLPESVAREFEAVVFEKEKDKKIIVATADPEKPNLKNKLEEILKTKDFKLAFALPEDIATVFVHYRKPLETRFSQMVSKGRVAADLLESIFKDAALLRASDIHIEPHEKFTIIRFRIDGVLHDAGRIPREYHESLINRTKVLAKLRTDEHHEIQDGSIRWQLEGRSVEFRVSIAPIYDGEKAVLRVLAYYVRGLTLNDLGFSSNHLKLVEGASRKPFGMIIASGPTGSGKTTTLYAVTKLLNTPGINITTVEDPVEYKIEGVNHIQVNEEVELTFAKGLKSIVRQDPDIILVGEIRDNETADIAINAALTGHLLLSTLHANDAATSIPRLLEMKVEPFLIASTVEIIIAQRLVRRICEGCRVSIPMDMDEIKELLSQAEKFFGKTKTVRLYKGKGCEACNHTGYLGRIGIFEVLPATTELRELILKKPTISEIYKLEESQGIKSIFEDGLDKVKNGITTLEEILRVARPRSNNHYAAEEKEKTK
jgi:type IV pilus assembly protein PilB